MSNNDPSSIEFLKEHARLGWDSATAFEHGLAEAESLLREMSGCAHTESGLGVRCRMSQRPDGQWTFNHVAGCWKERKEKGSLGREPQATSSGSEETETGSQSRANHTANLLSVLQEMATFHGAAHDGDCPEDDTCDCKYKPFNDRVNETIRAAMALGVYDPLTHQLAQLRVEYDEEVKSHDIEETNLKAKLQAREQEVGELREYVDLSVDGFAQLVIMCGYPPTEQIFRDPARMARMAELKAKLFDVKAERKEG